MRKFTLLLSAAGAGFSVLAYAGGGNWQPLQASYLIHSEGASYPEAPTAADRVITVVIDGKGARELFDSIGPDYHLTCSGEKGDRARRKKGVMCSYTAQDAGTKEGPYRCWLGLNLNTGDGDMRVSC